MTTLDHRVPTVDVAPPGGSGHPPAPQPLVDPGRSPGLGPPSPGGRHHPGRRPLHLGAVVVSGHGQRLLRGRRQIGNGELEGVSVRLPRPGELHHRRQAPGLAVGDGALGTDLRLLELEHAPPRGVGRSGHRCRPLPPGASVVRRCCRPSWPRWPWPSPRSPW